VCIRPGDFPRQGFAENFIIIFFPLLHPPPLQRLPLWFAQVYNPGEENKGKTAKLLSFTPAGLTNLLGIKSAYIFDASPAYKYNPCN
jgi:hypothetical protein